jgi:osmotically-inducible protein OsmY
MSSVNRVWWKSVVITLVAELLIATMVVGAPVRAHAAAPTLMQRVDRALRADRRLNGAACYTTGPGIVVLFGKVFDDSARARAETTAANVRGVNQVINTLTTYTGQWLEEEVRINDTLQLNGFQNVYVRVIGSQAYLSGQVDSEAEKRRAVRTVSAVSNLQVNNIIRVVSGPVFSTPSF